jgi:mRNA interferase MazF
MRRGDVMTVDASGDYGKPRPAFIVQSDAFPETHAFIVVCQMTSDLRRLNATLAFVIGLAD